MQAGEDAGQQRPLCRGYIAKQWRLEKIQHSGLSDRNRVGGMWEQTIAKEDDSSFLVLVWVREIQRRGGSVVSTHMKIVLFLESKDKADDVDWIFYFETDVQ
ncbi:hypothetical protein DEO72_LG4g1880 [Vigna unguiculata]|uniref:Uncharacterized protein n=1 Tax=Vigna unguiculata TaxID=3917 RepID=A0A4D6LPV2_VIGUN|nr:hypothetical protein DEO72_LG4g1880 [Vigna unguiculata]